MQAGFTLLLKEKLGFFRDVLLPNSFREKFSLYVFFPTAISLVSAIWKFRDSGLVGLAVVGILTSLTAGAFAEYLFQVAGKIEALANKRRFIKIFSYNSKSEQSVLVVLPKFRARRYQGDALETFENLTNGIDAKKLTYKDISRREYDAAIEVDVQAFSYIVS